MFGNFLIFLIYANICFNPFDYITHHYPAPYFLAPAPCSPHCVSCPLPPTPYSLSPVSCSILPSPYSMSPALWFLPPTPCSDRLLEQKDWVENRWPFQLFSVLNLFFFLGCGSLQTSLLCIVGKLAGGGDS